MNTWFRFYDSVLDDPKVQFLSDSLFKFWANCLCLACRNDGILPPLHSVSFAFRLPEKDTEESLQKLFQCGLLDKKNGKLTPHNWNKRQYKSDTSTPRVKRFRERFKTVSVTANETAPDTESDTEQIQIQNRTETDTEKKLALGEHGHALLTSDEYQKLKEKLNGYSDDFIAQFDNWVHEAPEASHAGVKRKNRNPYASINSWFDRAKKEGRLKLSTTKTLEQMNKELKARHGIQ